MLPIFPKNFNELKKKAPQLIAVAILAFGFLIVIGDALEDVLIDGQPFSGTLFYAILHTTILFTQNFTATVASLGYAGVFGLMLLESISLPIPSEVILPFAGYLVYLRQLDFWLTIAISTIAGVLGSLVDYCIGMEGLDILVKNKKLKKIIVNDSNIQRVEGWFNKYGAFAVFFSRLAPGCRTLISFPAGAAKMSISRFVLYTTAGCLVWDVVLVYAGMILGANWQQAAGFSNYLIAVVVIIIAALVVVFLIKRRQDIKRKSTSK